MTCSMVFDETRLGRGRLCRRATCRTKRGVEGSSGVLGTGSSLAGERCRGGAVLGCRRGGLDSGACPSPLAPQRSYRRGQCHISVTRDPPCPWGGSACGPARSKGIPGEAARTARAGPRLPIRGWMSQVAFLFGHQSAIPARHLPTGYRACRLKRPCLPAALNSDRCLVRGFACRTQGITRTCGVADPRPSA